MANKRKQQMAEYYQKTKEKQKAYSLNYHKKNREKVLKRMNEYNKTISNNLIGHRANVKFIAVER